MEELLVFLQQYAVLPIALICFSVGYLIKHYFEGIPNKLIPVILAILGLILNLSFNNFTFTPEIVINGIASGLIATGSFEAVRNLIAKKDLVKKE